MVFHLIAEKEKFLESDPWNPLLSSGISKDPSTISWRMRFFFFGGSWGVAFHKRNELRNL